MVGLVFPETDAEIVLHRETNIPSSVEIHYLVDDVVVAVAHYDAQGCEILVAEPDLSSSRKSYPTTEAYQRKSGDLGHPQPSGNYFL
jgi:hypothetical protein